MKALIVTINDNQYNYGNKLQNLAVSYVLKKIGISSKTLNFERKYDLRNSAKEYIEYAKFVINKATFYKLINPERKFYWKYEKARILNFKKFEKKYLPQHNDYNLNNSQDFDYYIIGSDQVWNPDFFKYHKMKKDAYLLTFCDDNKKICFSPSFGVSKLPNEWIDFFSKYLSKIDEISVREEEGVTIVKNLTHKSAEVTIDPTLMLSADEWLNFSNKPKMLHESKRFLLTYFLGNIDDSLKKYIKNIADINNLQIYNLLDKNDTDVYIAGPQEFIYLISKSSIVITDSFHASVFSFIFNKPFLVFDRKSEYADMSSRINTLLKKFYLEDRKGDISNYNNLFNIDYTQGYNILKNEREKMIKYLLRTMKL